MYFYQNKILVNLIQRKELRPELKGKLMQNGFIYEGSEEVFATNQAMQLRRAKEYLLVPTTLHIFVVSKNCNF